MYTVEENPESLHSSLLKRKIIRRVLKVDSLYLFHENEPTVDSLGISNIEGIPEFNGLRIWKDQDKIKIKEIFNKNPEKYIPLIKENEIKLRARGIQSELNSINGEMDSPWNLEYRVTSESLDNFHNVEKAEIDPAIVLVNIYVGLNYNPNIRGKVIEYTKKKEIPLIIFAPEGRDEKASKEFSQIKEEWNAKCGFVSGDVQWDGVLSVAETMFGFMGYPARDWLYENRVIQKAIREQ